MKILINIIFCTFFFIGFGFSLYSIILISDSTIKINSYFYILSAILIILIIITAHFASNGAMELAGVIVVLSFVLLAANILIIKDSKFTAEELQNQAINYYEEDRGNIFIYIKNNFLYDKNFIVFETELKEINADDSEFNTYKNMCSKVINEAVCYVKLTDVSKNEVMHIDYIVDTYKKHTLKVKYYTKKIDNENLFNAWDKK